MSTWNRIGYGLALLLLTGGVVGYVVHRAPWEQAAELRDSQREVDLLERERNALRERRDVLRQRVEDLKSDPVEVEASIRRGKGLIREGERIYRIPLPEDADAAQSP